MIAIDGNNQLYVAWQGQGTNGRWDVYVSHSSNGVSWSTPVVVNVGDSTNTKNQNYPSIAYDGLNPGTVYVAYEDDRAGNWDIWMAKSQNGTTWTETRITTDSKDQTQANVFIDRVDGEPTVVWTDARWSAQTAHILGASSRDPWKDSLIVTGMLAQSHAVGVAYSDTMLAWVHDNGSLTNICYGRILGGIETAAVEGGLPIVGTDIGDEDEPNIRQAAVSLALNTDHEVFAAWQDSRNRFKSKH